MIKIISIVLLSTFCSCELEQASNNNYTIITTLTNTDIKILSSTSETEYGYFCNGVFYPQRPPDANIREYEQLLNLE